MRHLHPWPTGAAARGTGAGFAVGGGTRQGPGGLWPHQDRGARGLPRAALREGGRIANGQHVEGQCAHTRERGGETPWAINNNDYVVPSPPTRQDVDWEVRGGPKVTSTSTHSPPLPNSEVMGHGGNPPVRRPQAALQLHRRQRLEAPRSQMVAGWTLLGEQSPRTGQLIQVAPWQLGLVPAPTRVPAQHAPALRGHSGVRAGALPAPAQTRTRTAGRP